jgi:hypothetical protein
MKYTLANKEKVITQVGKLPKLTKTIAGELGYTDFREFCSVCSILHWGFIQGKICKQKTKYGALWWK